MSTCNNWIQAIVILMMDSKASFVCLNLVFMERFCEQLPVPLENASVVCKLVQLVDVILVRVRPDTHTHWLYIAASFICWSAMVEV